MGKIRKFLHKKELCVFSLPPKWIAPPLNDLGNLEIAEANQKLIESLFRQDPVRRRLFMRFLASGLWGLIIHYQGLVWASYAWMSTPNTFGPVHLPSFVQRLEAYWIFYCRTSPEFQGRGLYKSSLITLCKRAQEQNPEATSYVDAEDSNIASIRCIQAVGFQPSGTVITWGLYIPKLKPLIWGKWDK